MEKYWKNTEPQAQAPPPVLPEDVTKANGDTGSSIMSDFDRHRLTLLKNSRAREGWQAELRRYEKDVPADVTPETDIVNWWQVCLYISTTS